MKSNNNNNSSCSSANSQCSEGDEASGTRNKTTMLKKGPWSAAEDAILIEYVQKHGEGNWNSVQKNCGLARCGKSCRLRWANHLRPNLKKGSFTPEEEMLILHLHAQYGNKWARMAAQMPGRTDNEIKNYWNTRIKRRQRAGLPIYPTRGVGGAHPPPALIPPSTNTGNPYNSLILQESPRVKRVRDDGLTFQFPTSPTAALSPYMNNNNSMGVAQTTSAMSMFQFNNNRNYMNTTELNNDGIYNGGGESQCRIMEALLQENGSDHNVQRSKWDFENSLNGNVFSGNGDRKDLLVDSLSKLDESTYSNGMRILKRERAESDETTNVSSTNDDISKIFDMISVPTGAPQAPEWHNPINVAADSCGLSNGAQSSVITDDELGLELQHFASSITQADQDWANIVGSSPWNNLPGIG